MWRWNIAYGFVTGSRRAAIPVALELHCSVYTSSNRKTDEKAQSQLAHVISSPILQSYTTDAIMYAKKRCSRTDLSADYPSSPSVRPSTPTPATTQASEAVALVQTFASRPVKPLGGNCRLSRMGWIGCSRERVRDWTWWSAQEAPYSAQSSQTVVIECGVWGWESRVQNLTMRSTPLS